jgi:hypothetical protein
MRKNFDPIQAILSPFFHQRNTSVKALPTSPNLLDHSISAITTRNDATAGATNFRVSKSQVTLLVDKPLNFEIAKFHN